MNNKESDRIFNQQFSNLLSMALMIRNYFQPAVQLLPLFSVSNWRQIHRYLIWQILANLGRSEGRNSKVLPQPSVWHLQTSHPDQAVSIQPYELSIHWCNLILLQCPLVDKQTRRGQGTLGHRVFKEVLRTAYQYFKANQCKTKIIRPKSSKSDGSWKKSNKEWKASTSASA